MLRILPVMRFLFFSGTLAASLLLGLTSAHAQTATAPVEGLRDAPNRTHALVGGRVVVAPGKVLENATIVVRDGLIAEVGAGLVPPPEARVWDVKGRTIYAGFIESETTVGLPEEYRTLPPRLRPAGAAGRRGAQRAAPTPPPKQPADLGGSISWNPRVTPQRNAADLLGEDEKSVEKLRSLGFASAIATPGRGVFRGSSALFQLGGREPSKSILRSAIAQHVAFEVAQFGENTYPSSLMGSIALVRQTFLDAQWYEQARQFSSQNRTTVERPEDNRALASLQVYVAGKAPVVFHTDDELDHSRALRLAEEFKLRPILRGNGYEYRSLARLAAAKPALVLPVNFPEPPEVETAERALDIQLDELEHWQEAPANAGRLAKAGVRFAFTSAGLDKPEKFWARLRETVKRGLSADDALAALTTSPAAMFATDDRLGTIEKGRIANLTVASGDLFRSEEAGVVAVWVDGEIHETEKGRERDVRGTWALALAGFPDAKLTLKFEGEPAKLKATLGEKDSVVATVRGGRLAFVPAVRLLGIGLGDGSARLSAELPAGAFETLEGTGQMPDGREFRWTAKRTAAFVKPPPKDERDKAERERLAQPVPLPEAYPAGAFGLAKSDLDAMGPVLVKGATIWTSGPQSTLEKADLLIEGGKIKAVGKDLTAPVGARVIDGTGKHVTAGLIDCHSHTAISRGVNEGTHSVTCEVRIGDVIDPTDVGIYRELAGGLTVANVLHGSSNSIGGQNQVIKLRWGMDAEALKFVGAIPGVKFALGENVKQSNWGNTATLRYPQTRMGVEEIIRDTFLGARDYERRLGEAKSGATTRPPVRRDLRMEAALEILRGERLVHCHSYRQDEVLMLIRLSQELGFTIGTFQHILEGYKVAGEIAKSGAGASSFADWWNYKIEATDAIPYNVAMLVHAGVVTSVNSDSAELARHLNTEAAKAMKYGGLTAEEAIQLVTLGPARQLHIDQQVGSLEPGKDGDFVIWDASPLSAYAKAEQTWIDGRCHFDRVRDAKLREDAVKRREALVQRALPERLKVLSMPPGGGGPPGAEGEKKPEPAPAEDGVFAEAYRHREGHWEREQRGLYHDGTDAHNCSSAELR